MKRARHPKYHKNKQIIKNKFKIPQTKLTLEKAKHFIWKSVKVSVKSFWKKGKLEGPSESWTKNHVHEPHALDQIVLSMKCSPSLELNISNIHWRVDLFESIHTTLSKALGTTWSAIVGKMILWGEKRTRNRFLFGKFWVKGLVWRDRRKGVKSSKIAHEILVRQSSHALEHWWYPFGQGQQHNATEIDAWMGWVSLKNAWIGFWCPVWCSDGMVLHIYSKLG